MTTKVTHVHWRQDNPCTHAQGSPWGPVTTETPVGRSRHLENWKIGPMTTQKSTLTMAQGAAKVNKMLTQHTQSVWHLCVGHLDALHSVVAANEGLNLTRSANASPKLHCKPSSTTTINSTMLDWCILAQTSAWILALTSPLTMCQPSHIDWEHHQAKPATSNGIHRVSKCHPPPWQQKQHNVCQPNHAWQVHCSSMYVTSNFDKPMVQTSSCINWKDHNLHQKEALWFTGFSKTILRSNNGATMKSTILGWFILAQVMSPLPLTNLPIMCQWVASIQSTKTIICGINGALATTKPTMLEWFNGSF